jgi:hypothetical protein
VTWEKNDTIYVAGRTIGRAIKVSLHPPEMGGYRLAYTKDFYANVRDRVPQREILTWPRPEVGEKEVTLVASICFPTDFMRSGQSCPGWWCSSPVAPPPARAD